ncbi:MAG: hypothetical protein CFH41_00254 [Alphaproteobacteria bacterium MarineAlpha11_Bin1]|nr:MAG: hypothetical protein CFH41_00254 [Alphaproteobacteria bacterium MarineAlpha11_Bin1]|tara:strand:+ start:17646 stop:17942 length:297 start_codon:yes stop_codon:yes gene_type:complete
MTLTAISESLRARRNVGQDVDSVIVNVDDSDSFTAATGIRPGDVLRRIDGDESSVPSESYGLLDAPIAEAQKRQTTMILLLVQRMEKDRYFAPPLQDT